MEHDWVLVKKVTIDRVKALDATLPIITEPLVIRHALSGLFWENYVTPTMNLMNADVWNWSGE